MKKRLIIGTLSIIASMLVLGCGSDSDSSTSTTSTTDAEVGYFIDSAVGGLDYNCTSGLSGVTDIYGRFQYQEGDKVTFSVGKLELGEATPDADGLVTPENLSDDNDTVILILRVLQSLDIDDDPTNGIIIPSDVTTELNSLDKTIDIETLKTDNDVLSISTLLADELDENYDGVIDVSPVVAEQHYQESTTLWHEGHRPDENATYGYGYGGDNGDGNCTDGDQNNTFDVNSYPMSTLNQELKDALAYMGNEERLAHDTYANLYNYHVENSGLEINQLINIADRSEETHVKTVQSIVRKYNITGSELTNVDVPVADSNISFEDMPSGVYGVPAIQSLYDALYAKGIQSQKDALEVGCMVEVTDINDLNEYIELAQESNATDIVDGFTMLRDASYNHYWAFDNGLQNIGISTGCCSLGEIDGVNYCHPEYPQNEHEDNTTTTEYQGNGYHGGRD